MPEVFALPTLFDDVVAIFLAEGTNVPQLFGWRESAKQLVSGTRIVWIPGDPSGRLGSILAPRGPGGNPRSLATLDELFTVEIRASDNTAPTNERAQYKAARDLYDAWYRAAYLARHGVIRVLETTWVIDKNERRHGAEIRAICAIQSAIHDTAHPIAPVDTHAELDVEELDVTETISIP